MHMFMESFTKYSLNGMLDKSFFFLFSFLQCIKPATNSVTSFGKISKFSDQGMNEIRHIHSHNNKLWRGW